MRERWSSRFEISLVCVVCQMRGGSSLFIGGRWWRYSKKYSPLFNMLLSSLALTAFQMMSSLSFIGWADFWGLWRVRLPKLGLIGICEGSGECGPIRDSIEPWRWPFQCLHIGSSSRCSEDHSCQTWAWLDLVEVLPNHHCSMDVSADKRVKVFFFGLCLLDLDVCLCGDLWLF